MQRYTFVISLSSLAHYAPSKLYASGGNAKARRAKVFSNSQLRRFTNLDQLTESLVTSLAGSLGGKVKEYVHFSRVMTPEVIEFIKNSD